MILVKRLLALLKKARNNKAGPMVIHMYNRDGGYLWVLMKESILNIAFFCEDQWSGSPYTLTARSTMKNKITAIPIAIKILFLFDSSILLMIFPKQ